MKTGTINLKGKPNWSSAIKKMDKEIFRNLNNDEIELDILKKKLLKQMTSSKGFCKKMNSSLAETAVNKLK